MNCSGCGKAGITRKADRNMGDGRYLCDEHYRTERGLPPPPMASNRVWCAGCLEQGKHVPANVKVNGVYLCHEHAKSAATGNPQPIAKEQHVETNKRAEQKAEAQKMRDAGTPVKEIANHFGKSEVWVYMNTKRKGKPAAGKLSQVADRAAPVKQTAKHQTAKPVRKSQDGFFAAIQTLKGMREEHAAKIKEIDAAIETLSNLDAR